MKKKTRLLAIMLAVAMVMTCVPVYAAPQYSNTYAAFSISGWWESFWNKIFGNSNKPEEKPEENKPETEIPEESDNGTDKNMELTVIEDDTTVINGDMLRASTYELSEAGASREAESENDTVLKYFPITMYDYDERINNATHEVELQSGADLEKWNGIYFNNGTPTNAEKYPATDGEEQVSPTFDDSGNAEIEDGEYLIVNKRNNKAVGAVDERLKEVDWSAEYLWTITSVENGYQIKCNDKYLTFGSGTGTYVADPVTVQLVSTDENSNNTNENALMIKLGSYYLNDYNEDYGNTFAGYNVKADAGSIFYLYRLPDGYSSKTLNYAEWNFWNKDSGSNDAGQKMYTGLVEKSLDANKDIVFTKAEGGIFNSDTNVKDIYKNVELPFVYSNGTYTFDASTNGVYFYEDTAQGSSGTAKDNARLYFAKKVTQSNGMSFGDGSTTMWLPFNNGKLFTESDTNYHFGMKTTIPFTMTKNGCLYEDRDLTADGNAPIQFSFSGDDDVWVFIDGQLVVDLGGIHNRLDVKIDFAANTVVYSESNALNIETGSYNDGSFALEQTLFENLIRDDIETFAATDHHELTIFYLERGKGSSNCKIEFNLPVKDSITVRKDATQSWSATTNEVTPLTSVEQETVNNVNFEFTLYKKDAEGNYSPLTNTSYFLLNENHQVIDRGRSTDSNGRFTLKNGQSARFITSAMDDDEGATYYVTETPLDGYTTPDYNYGGTAADGYVKNGEIDNRLEESSQIGEKECFDQDTSSDKITVYGSMESEDSLEIICSNFLDAELPNPSVKPQEDKIVIDYGLPVEIDVLANDTWRGNTRELVGVYGAGITVDPSTGDVSPAENTPEPKYGAAEVIDGKITYTLTKQLTSVEVLNYVVKVTGTAVEGGKTPCAYAVGTAYVIPATSMYYEENFSDMVTFKGNWTDVGTPETDKQESGVVGTVGDSPYGSDTAYLKDSSDSNGSSKYVSTTDGAAQFSYTFTGWGTSFFARTSNSTGYMRIVITKDNETVYTAYRNTVYKVDSATLYNIPVFTYNADDYGTYTVTVTIAKGSSIHGSDFWLDGIRVLSPLNKSEEAAADNIKIALDAYVADQEENMVVETLRYKLLTDVTVGEDDSLAWSVEDQENGNFVLFTDIDGEMTSAYDYQSFGPKEEVYLNHGQKVSFSLNDWDANSNKIYLGMKAPTGSGTVIINGTQIVLSNAADCYYDITNFVRITDGNRVTLEIQADEDSLISITNIKVTGNVEFGIIGGNEDFNGDINPDGDENNNPEDVDVENPDIDI